MLIHEDDYRIMTDVDMVNAKDLSDPDWEEGATPQEARLKACIRLLLAHIEGITDGTIVAVECHDDLLAACKDMASIQGKIPKFPGSLFLEVARDMTRDAVAKVESAIAALKPTEHETPFQAMARICGEDNTTDGGKK